MPYNCHESDIKLAWRCHVCVLASSGLAADYGGKCGAQVVAGVESEFLATASRVNIVRNKSGATRKIAAKD